MEHCEIATGTLGACCSHARLVGSVQAERVNKTVAVVVRQIHDLAVGDFAILLGEPDIPFGVKPFGFLIVDDPVCFEGRSSIIDLHIANRGNAVVCVVVVDLVRLNEHLLLSGFFPLQLNLGFSRRGRSLRKLQLLRRRVRSQSIEGQKTKDGGKHRQATAIRPRP